MEVFVFNPRLQRETLQQFNERVQEFCLQHAVVQITPASIGSNLVLSLLMAEDLDQPGMPTFMPAIRPIKTDDADLEEQLSKFLEGERRKSTEDEPRIPSQLLIVERKDKADVGWAVMVILNGEADDEDEGDDGEEEPEPDDSAPTGPAVAFPLKVHNAEVVH